MTSKHSFHIAELDPHFGTDGRVEIRPPGNFKNYMPGLAIDASGELLIYGTYERETPPLGQPGVARLKNDGSVDIQFGDMGDGFTTAPTELLSSSVSSIGIAADGGFFATAAAGSQLPLVRYDRNGKYNADWKLAEGQPSTSPQILITKEGKVLIAKGGSNGGELYRRNDDGTADADFGEGGRVTFLTDSRYLTLLNMACSANTSSFYLAGELDNDGFILRLQQTGEPDSNFGDGGLYRVQMPGSVCTCRKVHETATGKIIALATASSGGRVSTDLIGLTSAGVIDPDFNNGEPLRLPGNVGEDFGVQEDGKIIAASRGVENSLLTRYMPDGTPDDGFGEDGSASIVFPAEQISALKSVIVQADGKIVVSGSLGSITTLLRLMP